MKKGTVIQVTRYSEIDIERHDVFKNRSVGIPDIFEVHDPLHGGEVLIDGGFDLHFEVSSGIGIFNYLLCPLMVQGSYLAGFFPLMQKVD